MENCLWQEFKEDTNNDSLKKLGVLRVYLNAFTGNFIIKHYEDLTPCEYSFYDLQGNLVKSGQSRSSSLPNQYIYVELPNGGYIEIANKYNLYSFTSEKFNVTGNIALQPKAKEYMYCEHVHSIAAIDYMAEYAKLPVVADIQKGAYQKGDILDFVNLVRQKGVTSGNIFFSIYKYPNTTTTLNFNGRLVISSTTSTSPDDRLFWDADKCYVRAKNGQIIFCYGYTDAQIAELTGTGGDWQGATVTKVD